MKAENKQTKDISAPAKDISQAVQAPKASVPTNEHSQDEPGRCAATGQGDGGQWLGTEQRGPRPGGLKGAVLLEPNPEVPCNLVRGSTGLPQMKSRS
jgi:hypothetical protein